MEKESLSAPPTPPMSTHHKPSFYQTAKRKVVDNVRSRSSSISLPKFFQTDKEMTPPGTPRAATVAPTHHRENTALHALLDSLPTLPTLTAPSLPSLSFASLPSFSTPAFFCHASDAESSASESEEEAQPHSTPITPEKDKEKKKDPIKRLTGNVVVLGGYRGSILRDAKTLKRVWIPLRVGFGLRRPDLGLGLDDESELRSTETIVPGRMLMAVGGLIDLGKKFKDKLKALEASHSSPTLKFHNWGYDWRRRLELSSAELLKYLVQLKKESAARGEGPDGKGEGATVIAHSMGGLVTLHALARAEDPTIFKAILFAGTPFKGCVNALGPLKLGDGVLFNREICSPAVVFSMRSTFYFLPLDGKSFETPTGESLPLDFFSTKTWSDHALSPLTADLLASSSSSAEHVAERKELKEEAETADLGRIGVEGVLEPTMGGGGHDEEEAGEGEVGAPIVVPGSPGEEENEKEVLRSDNEIEEYLERTLKRAKDFNHSLVDLYDPARSSLYPPMCIITSHKTPTVRGIQLATSASTIREATSYEHLLFGEGDGIVTYESAHQLPGPWNHHLVGVEESGHGHVSLLGDLDTVRRALERLEVGARK